MRAFVSKKTSPGETVFTVWAPPSLGYYKLVISAARVPRVKAKVMMPVVATFLVGDLQHVMMKNAKNCLPHNIFHCTLTQSQYYANKSTCHVVYKAARVFTDA